MLFTPDVTQTAVSSSPRSRQHVQTQVTSYSSPIKWFVANAVFVCLSMCNELPVRLLAVCVFMSSSVFVSQSVCVFVLCLFPPVCPLTCLSVV